MKFGKTLLASALVFFLIGTIFGAVTLYFLSIERSEYLFDNAPVPPAGQSVRLQFRPADDWRRYRLELHTSVVDPESVLSSDSPPYPCNIHVIISQNSTVWLSDTLVLEASGAMFSRPTAIFSSDTIEFESGWHDIDIENQGCEEGFAFTGGVLSIGRVGPITLFSAATIWLLGAVLFSVLGMLATLLGAFLYRRGRHAKLRTMHAD